IVFVVEAGQWRADDKRALAKIRAAGAPVGLVVNKVDRMHDKAELLPFITQLSAAHDFAFVVPLSARRRRNLDALKTEIMPRMPVGPYLYPQDEYTDRNLRFIVDEVIREKLMLQLQQELPYAIAIEIESFDSSGEQIQIHACIWVARDSHKAIVIGRRGQMLKKVGPAARHELVRQLGRRVDLRLWVKVRANWIDDENSVRSLGH